MYYVYALQDQQGRTYIGYSNDLRRRVAEHNSGLSKSTHGRKWQLVYYEAYKSKSDAQRREDNLKMRGQAVRQLKERIRDSLKGQS